jgi:proteic killer suppression protein
LNRYLWQCWIGAGLGTEPSIAIEHINCLPDTGNRYSNDVIRNFKDENTRQVFEEGSNRRWNNIASVARRKLLMIHAAHLLAELNLPPANRLEALHGDREGQHSIRINDQFRICFEWKADGAHKVEIADYH